MSPFDGRAVLVYARSAGPAIVGTFAQTIALPRIVPRRRAFNH